MFAVGFDFDHTLGFDNRLERKALLQVLAEESASPDQDLKALGGLIDEALHEYRSGRSDLSSALHALFAKTGKAEGDRDELFDRFVEVTLSLAPTHITPVPGACELLDRLKAAGVPTAILTNGWNPLQQCKADLIGYDGPVIVSDDIELRKPDKRAFQVLAAALELPLEKIFFVGDSQENDVVGALNAGMQAIWFNGEGQTYNPSYPAPSIVITSLDEVDAYIFGSVPS